LPTINHQLSTINLRPPDQIGPIPTKSDYFCCSHELRTLPQSKPSLSEIKRAYPRLTEVKKMSHHPSTHNSTGRAPSPVKPCQSGIPYSAICTRTSFGVPASPSATNPRCRSTFNLLLHHSNTPTLHEPRLPSTHQSKNPAT